MALIASLLTFAPISANAVADGNINCGTSGTFTIASNVVTTSSACEGSVVIPEGVTSIADSAFYAKSAVINSLSLPSTLVTISDNAFRVSGPIQTLNIPENVTTIGARAFSLNSTPRLNSLTFSAGSKIDWIKDFAFEYSNFSSVIIPSSLTKIGGYAFITNSALSQITFLGSAPSNGGESTNFDVPAGVTALTTSQNRSSFVTAPSTTWRGITVASAPATCTTSESVSGSKQIVKFLTTGSCEWTIPAHVTSLSLLVVGGGGGGGQNMGGGGGGGGLYYNVSETVTASAKVMINVGSGGLGSHSGDGSITARAAGNGAPSAFGDIVTQGGGAGGDLNDINQVYNGASGGFGGSGGGGFWTFPAGSGSNSGLYRFGNSGGNGTASDQGAGGGGGAGGVGGIGVNDIGGAGGAGKSISITGQALFYAGGGGGGGGTAGGAGGDGGGAAGTVSGVNPVDATANTGGGGGGYRGGGGVQFGSAGGSGIVIVSYDLPVAAPAFTLSSSSETVTVGTAITGYTINSTGGTIASFSISPAISDTPGLSFSTSTGLITGTPTTAAASKTYTITATNATSPSATRTFALAVNKGNQTVTWAPTTALAITSSPATPSSLATTSGDGTISYAVTSAGTTGCSVNSSTGVITYTAPGSCQVTATAASTANYNSATAVVTFTVALASRTLTIDTSRLRPVYLLSGGRNRLPTITATASAGTGTLRFSAGPNDYRFLSSCSINRDGTMLLLRSALGYFESTCLITATISADATYAQAQATTIVILKRPFVVTIGYSPNGATGTPERLIDRLDYDKTPGVTLPGVGTMVKPGYTFAGWSESGSAPILSSPYENHLDVTLKAVWIPIDYTVTYDPNGGNSTPTQASRNIGQTFSLANAITKNDANSISYTFAGWNNGSSIIQAGETITVGTANLNYSATWVEEFEVTYANNGGSFSSSDTLKDSECLGARNKCSSNQAITLNSAPTRAGYTFAGWKDQSGALVSDTDPAVANVQTTVTTSRYIFTASWTPISYTVTYVSDGSGAPTQSSRTQGQIFTIGAAVTKSNNEFAGWSDGTTTYWPDSIYLVGSSNITLTAQWTSLFSVTYSAGSGIGTPPSGSDTNQTGSSFELPDVSELTKTDFTFAGWSDGTTTYQAGATYTVGASNVVLTAQWTANAPTATPVVVGPPPSTIKTITAPKISRDSTHYICTPGTYVFVRNGVSEEATRLTSQIYSLLQDGKVVESITSALAEVKFEIKSSYMNSTLSCAVQVGQENLLSTVSSISSKVIAEANQAKRADLDRIEVQYVADRTAAYANKDKEFARIEALKKTEMASAKSSAAILLVSAKYRKAFTAATDLWKVELQKATTNRDAGRLAPQATYLNTLEKAGASIYPQEAKAVVTPTPTPSVTPKPTPSPTQTTNPQPTAQMEKVGTVYMASGSYFLNDATKKALVAAAIKINASGAKSILVYGHTDNRGGVNNTVLSQNRAKAVANFLRPLLTSKKISIGWYASKKPVAGGTSAAALALNRRVEIYTK